uniref:alcohol dehydrogenase (NADP(+)) n=1 Tax=Phallusia mammillata TaxID=59560 RepID=A0A6F9D6P3_9ASCI|nr:aldose reductase-like [Phallusia mammillata]
MAAPTFKLNTGHEMPFVGLGTWKSKPGEVQAAVECAIDVGYRHIDCALCYENEKEAGAGINAKINSGKVKREDLFIVSKLWNTHHDPKDVRSGLMQSLGDLKLDYLDLYLMHWPMAFANNGKIFPRDDKEQLINADVDYVETYKAMEKLLDEGLVKNIGVSNFNEFQLGRILKECKVVPANHQIEIQPYLLQEDMVQLCKKNEISLTAYSPLGSRDRPWVTKEEPNILEDPKILKIAERLGKSPAQVLIRFQVQRGINVIPKSVTPSRIESNIQVFDFELSADDETVIRSMKTSYRACTFLPAASNKYFPFRENYKE